MTNTLVNYEGIVYQLIEEAYATNYGSIVAYEAPAIRANDKADEDGYLDTYTIRWLPYPDYDGRYMEEDTACDWDTPEEVIERDMIHESQI